jgi:hypothetical protein
MAAADGSAADWKDLNIRKNFAEHSCTPTQALCELLANALDANRAVGTALPPPSLRISGEDVVLEDQGSGLELKHFVIGRPAAAAASSLGQFGVGLKDAVAALVRVGATVQMESLHGRFDFSERTGSFGEETIHVRFMTMADSRAAGTKVTVHGLAERAQLVAEAMSCFLAMTHPSPRPLLTIEGTAFGTITLYPPAPATKHHYYLYIHGVKKKCASPLLLQYDVAPTAGGAELCFGRDHNVTKLGPIMDAIAKAARATPSYLAELRRFGFVPSKPSCEFALGDLRELLFPEAATLAVAAPPAPVAMSISHRGAGTGSAVPSAASAAGASAGSAVKLVVLYDYENAHNASVPLAARVAASAAMGWHMMVFVGNAPTAVQASANVEVITALTTSPQAADSQLCFNAGIKHKQLPAHTAFLVVCGTEGRYSELVTGLRAVGHRTELLRFDTALGAARFDADITRAVTNLGV